MEHLSLLGDIEVGMALSLKREIESKGLTSKLIFETSVHEESLRREIRDLMRFAKLSLNNLVLSHESTHIGFRRGFIRLGEVSPDIIASLEDFIRTVREAGEKHLTNFKGAERRKEEAILDEMCKRLRDVGASPELLEEIYCDTFAASMYARQFIAPLAAGEASEQKMIERFREGFWIILTFMQSLFLFDKIAYAANTIISKKGWNNEVAFSGAARARDGITSHVYRSASRRWVLETKRGRKQKRLTDELDREFELANSHLYKLFLLDFAWLSEIVAWQSSADTISAARSLASGGAIEQARSEIWRFLGWRESDFADAHIAS
jgi:hypothetical protein